MIYVIVQFSCIFYFIFNARFEALDTFSYVFIGIAIIIGLSAVATMKLSNLNIVPTLKDQHQLVTSGIYRWIRHPMYTSVLALCFAFATTNDHKIAQLVMLVLLVDLVLKSNLEEKLLTQRFDSYQNYKSKTGRFIPFL
ncbi:MAG: hypothetical protein Ctma_0581 [Catillopecten margaritatus gill symbiont]|uniref:Isoprenylcysteine carboxyl methyltransferase n=1 Tax=Catillopecten margaritatus gill symbiont TaxID=3083288 RepID=A0AAU6PFS8_9GAMM